MRMGFVLFVLMVCAYDCTVNSSPYAITGADLAYYYLAEEVTIHQIHNLIGDVEEQLDLLERQTLEHKFEEDLDSLVSLLSHPIDGYNVLKRTIERWAPIKETTERIQTIIKDAFVNADKYRKEMGFPEEGDLDVLILGILKSLDLYQRDINTFIEGNITHFQDNREVFVSSVKLSASDCLMFAKAANEIHKHHQVVEFCEAALKKLDSEDDEAEEMKEEIEELLENAVSEMGQWIRIPEDEEEEEGEDDTLWRPPTKVEETVHQLCRGDTIMMNKKSDVLSCRYIRSDSPYLLLGPMKVEFYSLNPLVMLIHDAIYDREIEMIKKYSFSKLHMVNTGTEEETKGDTKKRHRSILLARGRLMEQFTRRIEAFTGFNMKTFRGAEPYEISSYGVERELSSIHYDFLQTDESFQNQIDSKFRGDRIATLQTYLSDVEAGGATVFPDAKTAIFPKKGSAVLWYNLKRNGEGDQKSLHAECPVLQGTKWVMNKWIGYYDQMFNAPCGLQRNDRFKAEYSGSQKTN